MLFEQFCENRDDIEWVYKNGDTGQQYFSIVYRDGLQNQWLFYADYIIMKKDGTVWVIETKGGESKGKDKNIDMIWQMTIGCHSHRNSNFQGSRLSFLLSYLFGISQSLYCWLSSKIDPLLRLILTHLNSEIPWFSSGSFLYVQFYLLIATAVGGSIFLVKTGSVLSINQQWVWGRNPNQGLLLVSNTKLSKWQYCNTRVDLALVFSPHQIGLWYLDATLKILWCSLIIMNSCLLSISLLDLYVILW